MAKSRRLQQSPLCNEKALAQAVAETGETPKFVRDILDFHADFIAQKIKAGGFESVSIIGFGTFQPKLSRLAAKGYGKAPAFTRRIYGGEPYGTALPKEGTNDATT